MPNCGRALVLGNQLYQGAATSNFTAIAYGAEGCDRKEKSLTVAHNTYVNDHPGGNFVKNWTSTPALIANNLLASSGKLVDGPAERKGDLLRQDPALRTPDRFDYRLRLDSAAIDAAVDLGMPAVVPDSEYRHPLQVVPRVHDGDLDVGAFEFAR